MRKIDAIILILGVIIVASWVIFSSRDGFKGNNAMIVARSISVAATLGGRVDNALPAAGSKFTANDLLVTISDSRADRTRLADFESQIDYLENEIANISSQQSELKRLLEQFEQRARKYAQWLLHDVKLRKVVNQRKLDVAKKRRQIKADEVARLALLLKTKSTSRVNAKLAGIAADIAEREVELAATELDRSDLLVESLQAKGIFLEDGDANYWTRSADALRMRCLDNHAKIVLLKGQLARAVAQAEAEREHLQSNVFEEHRAPFSGVVNATFVTQGARVAIGTELLQLLDCTRPTVVIPIPDHRIGEFTVGMKATVYPIDSTDELVGKIIHISSAAQLGTDTSIQLEKSLTLQGIRATIGFGNYDGLGALSEPCETARKAVVVIHTESLYENIANWISAFTPLGQQTHAALRQ